MQPRQRKKFGNIDGFVRQPSNRLPKKEIPQINQKTYLNQSTLSNNNKSSSFNTQKYGQNKFLKNSKIKKKWSWKKKLLFSICLIILIILGVGIWLGGSLVANLDKVFHGNIFSDISSVFSSVTLKGENNGRVNILLVGNSEDQPGHGGQMLADTIIVLSIDTRKDTAFMLSIPRDLWVYIPGFPYNNGFQKINAANDGLGKNFNGYPSGGPGQLEHVITTDLGIPIDYYAESDYTALVDVVNAVGGINVDIQSPDPRGLYDPNTNLNLPNGPAFLNGQEALNLARARGDGPGSYGFPNSDFDRTANQRMILQAIATKAKSLGFLSNPIKISNVFNALGNNIQTDLSLSDVFRLITLTQRINLNNTKSYAYCSTLSQNSCGNVLLTTYFNQATSEDALIPKLGIGNYSAMQSYYQQLTKQN